ncbi:uncharacterized protein LOC135202797 [Macrobrachium nipponense]|uniref:uncharacterized protein LOC135202797 n=1 Tax=Macrobrachium nipponense TaxID=159736 RepID=UPI0030C830B0
MAGSPSQPSAPTGEALPPASAGMGSRLRPSSVETFLLLRLGWAAASGPRRSSPSSCFGWDGQPPPAPAVEPFLLLRLGWQPPPSPRRSRPSSCFGWDGQPPLAPAGRALPPASAGMGSRLWPPPVEPFLLLRLGWAAASGPSWSGPSSCFGWDGQPPRPPPSSPSSCFGWDGQPTPAPAGRALPPASAGMGSRLRPRRSRPSSCFGWDGQPPPAPAGRDLPPASAGMGSRLWPPPVEPFLLLRLGWAAASGPSWSGPSSCFGWDGQPPPVPAGQMGSRFWPPPVKPFLLLRLGWAAASGPRRSSPSSCFGWDGQAAFRPNPAGRGPSSCFGWDGQPPPAPTGRALPPASAGMGSRLRPPPVEPFLLLRRGWAAAFRPRRLIPSSCFGRDEQPPSALAGQALPPAMSRMGSSLRSLPVEPFLLLSTGMGSILCPLPVELFLLLQPGWATASGPSQLGPSSCFSRNGQQSPASTGQALLPALAGMGSSLRPPPVEPFCLLWQGWAAASALHQSSPSSCFCQGSAETSGPSQISEHTMSPRMD